MVIFLCMVLAWHVVKGIGAQLRDDFGQWTKDKVGAARNRWSEKKSKIRSRKSARGNPRLRDLPARAGLFGLDLLWSIGRSIKKGAVRGWRSGRARWKELKEQRAEKKRGEGSGKKSRGKHRPENAEPAGTTADPGPLPVDEMPGPHVDVPTQRPEPTEEEMVELAEAIRRAGEGGNVTQPGQVDVEASSLATQRKSWESFQESAAADLEAAQAEAARLQEQASAAVAYAEGLASQGMDARSVAPAVNTAEAKQRQADHAANAAVAAEESLAASQVGLQEHAIHEGVADARQGRQLANSGVYEN